MNLTLRWVPLAREWLSPLAQLERGAYNPPWTQSDFAEELERPHSLSQVAVSPDNTLAGAVVAWLLMGELHIHKVTTAPEFKRQGVARGLLQHTLAQAQALGAERALLELRAQNTPALSLYQSLGFVIDGRRAKYYPDGEDALLMSRGLAEGRHS